VTDNPLAPGFRASGEVRALSTRNAHEGGAVTALEPSEPTRAARGRLRLAATARAAIDHPNLVRARPVGEGDGRLFIAFERCPQPSLTELLAAAPLEPTECARILDGAAAGVDALNERTLVARDLTPERVLVHPERGGVLMDLGIPPELLRRVPLEQDPDLAFRSPEEVERKPVDLRSSVYSLGALFFTALTGLPPGNYSPRLAEAGPRPSDRRIELSPEIDAVITRALARDPAERYANPEALSRAVAAAVGADLAPKIRWRDLEPNGRRQQRLPKHGAASPQRNGGRPRTPPRQNDRPMLPRDQTNPQPGPTQIPPSPRQAEPRAQDTGGRITRVARDGWKSGSRLVGSGTATAKRALSSDRARRGPAAIRTAAQHASTHRKLLLLAIGAIVASALAGLALGRAFEPEAHPLSVSRSGLTVQLQRGWEPVGRDRVLSRPSPAIAAAPSGDAGAGFLAGKLSSLAAAERMLARVQRESDGRTQVRLGGRNAWQYAGLRLRPHVVGTGYLVPTTGGTVLEICHASTNDAPVRLAECNRIAATLVVRGERPRLLSSADRSNERTTRVIATLRANRWEGRRRLDAAELGRGQARAARSLQLNHKRAAWSLDRISVLENGYSLAELSAAVGKAAAAYRRLARAALVSNRSAYRKATDAVVREDEVLRRELERMGDA
jgi:hypothetical protein